MLNVTLTNKGKAARCIVQRPYASDVSVDAPKEWDYHMRIYGIHSNPPPEITLEPGEKITETLRLHEQFRRIPSGKVLLPVWWRVTEPVSGKEQRTSWATRNLELDIAAATPDRVGTLLKRMEERMRDPNLTYSDRRTLADDLELTHHPELTPVAWAMVESYEDYPRPLWFIEDSGTPCEEIDGRVLKLLEDPRWPGTYDTFSYWDRRKTPLSGRQFQRLLDTGSVWTRVLTYRYFPQRCDKEWKAALFRDLRMQTQPVPSQQFDGLLAKLDSDDFELREQASADLTRLGERVEGQLRHAQETQLSAEANQRVKAILDKLRDAKQSPECIRTLQWLESSSTPETGEILEVLADGQPDAWLTQQAKKQLAEWRKAHDAPDK
ncbi:MAG TPA: hypothetical protein VMS17_33095 [Gemmataceae bacterium]|nr:hypothetical protein [Gemmataceae bacterium]